MESEAGGQSSDWRRCAYRHPILSPVFSAFCRYWRSTESLCPEMSSTSRLDKLQALRRGDDFNRFHKQVMTCHDLCRCRLLASLPARVRNYGTLEKNGFSSQFVDLLRV